MIFARKEGDMPAPTQSSSGNRVPEQHWPADRKVALVLEGLRGHRPLTELCREAGITPVRFCQWRDQFIDAGRAGLACPQAGKCTLEERVKRLEAENASLRRQVQILQELCLAE
jgi:transposase-like protein